MAEREPNRVGSLGWLAQAATGVLLLGLAGLHFVAHHYVVEGGLRDFAQVQAYLGHPLIWPLEGLFLLTVTAHALLGLRAVALDLGLSGRAERWLTRTLWLVGALTVAYGFWLTWTILSFQA